MKEIIKGAIVIHPALCSEVTLVADKKTWVFVVLLKLDYRKMISLHKRAKLCVIITTGELPCESAELKRRPLTKLICIVEK